MAVKLADIPASLQLPRPRWLAIRQWIEANIPLADQRQTWQDVTLDWLEKLGQALPTRYHVWLTHKLLLFAPCEHEQAEILAGFTDDALAQIQKMLGNIVGEHWVGSLVVMLFPDSDSYYDYVSQYYPDGEHGGSGGICLHSEGHVHVAMQTFSLDESRRILIHELTHAALSHLKIPAWLEEGLTQAAEEAVKPGWRNFSLDAKEARALRDFWRKRGLQDFWWGTGFGLADETQTNCYRLSEVLLRLIYAEHPSHLTDFVRESHHDDAGQSAAHKLLGKNLSDIAGQFLGNGDWTPIPVDEYGFYRRGVLRVSQQCFADAVADFTEAIRLNGDLNNAIRMRGHSLMRLKRYSEAMGDFQSAVQRNSEDAAAHNSLAWLLATCPDDGLRDGAKAVEHAHKSCDLSEYQSPECLDTLAAALAEIGEWDEAIQCQREAIRLAPEVAQAMCQEKLAAFKDRKPHRNPNSDLEPM